MTRISNKKPNAINAPPKKPKINIFKMLDSWSAYMITSYEDAERYFGRKADKNRKIYNGMLKTYFYQFLGPKPPKRPKEPKQ